MLKEYLENHSFEDLTNEFGIHVNVDDRNSKVSLNYDQIHSPRGNPIVEQCRGLVIRPSNTNLNQIVGDYKVLARPMLRFYNIEEGFSKVDLKDPNLIATNKLDGTCTILYWDDLYNEFCVATRSTPEAHHIINKTNEHTFTTLFWEAVAKNHNYNDFIAKLDKKVTYIFELTSIFNRVVVRYNKTMITLIAAIETDTGKELDIYNLNINVPKPECWKLNGLKQIRAFVNSFEPENFEGVVLVDSNFNRAKVKSDAYLLAHKLKGSIENSPRAIIEGIINGNIEKAIQFVDDDSKIIIEKMKKGYNDIINRINANFNSWVIKSRGDRKNFALLVQESKEWQKPYFALFEKMQTNKNATIKDTIVELMKKNKISNKDLDFLYNSVMELV